MHSYTHLSHDHLIAIIKEKEQEIDYLKTKNTALLLQLEGQDFSLKKIIELMPGNVYWKNKDGKYLGCNNNIAQLINLSSPNDIIGKTIRDFCPAELAAAIEKTDWETMNSNEAKYFDEAGFSVNHNEAFYLTQKIPLRNKLGEAIGLLGISFDITKRKLMEEELRIAKEKAEASNRAKSQFLAAINHELRTPLASIIGLIGLLKKNKAFDEGKENITAIENCSNHLLNLVNDVLEFSRLETEQYQYPVHTNLLNLRQFVNETCHILKPLALQKKLDLRIHIDATLPENILADSHILRQILINLLSNAIKFTERGHILIQITDQGQKNNYVRLEIAVIDTGEGIPSDKQQFIFEPFQQLENAYTRRSSRSGTGLGLAIVKKLAALMNASIHVTSELYKGSTFSITSEFKIPPSSSLVHSEFDDEKIDPIYPNFLTRQPYILLVEDDPIIQHIHQSMLESLGCKVDLAPNGHEAITKLNHHDIVLVDISLPDMNGFEVIQHIRKRNHPSSQTPIIALTAHTGEEEKLACLNAGTNEFVTKPIHLAQLKQFILRYINFK